MWKNVHTYIYSYYMYMYIRVHPGTANTDPDPHRVDRAKGFLFSRKYEFRISEQNFGSAKNFRYSEDFREKIDKNFPFPENTEKFRRK